MLVRGILVFLVIFFHLLGFASVMCWANYITIRKRCLSIGRNRFLCSFVSSCPFREDNKTFCIFSATAARVANGYNAKELKVLIELFQKFAGKWGSAPEKRHHTRRHSLRHRQTPVLICFFFAICCNTDGRLMPSPKIRQTKKTAKAVFFKFVKNGRHKATP